MANPHFSSASSPRVASTIFFAILRPGPDSCIPCMLYTTSVYPLDCYTARQKKNHCSYCRVELSWPTTWDRRNFPANQCYLPFNSFKVTLIQYGAAVTTQAKAPTNPRHSKAPQNPSVPYSFAVGLWWWWQLPAAATSQFNHVAADMGELPGLVSQPWLSPARRGTITIVNESLGSVPGAFARHIA